SHTIILENLGSNSFGFSFPINSSTRPGTYVLSVSLKYTGNYSIINSSITVLPYYSYTKKPVSSFGLFGGESSVTIKNTGNEPIPSKNLSLSVAGISSLFLISKYSSLGSPVISNGVLYPSVPYLQPGQTISMSYSESFIPLYVIILIVIAAIVIFFYLNRKVVITKEVAEHKAVGGFIDVKIAIRVRNVSKRPLTSISVKDWVPPNSLKVSSIGPKEGKIARQGNNVHINWMEDNLNPGDEIILMYSIKSKIGIIGSIKLSKATVRFEYNSKKYEKKSNSLVLNIK
ncbi:hypothetical protein M1293_04065, partial [Candidatus Parvarchaeota archaeon]|nr:hypothetical protein [Candidatus Parvarchaeota archaeon]